MTVSDPNLSAPVLVTGATGYIGGRLIPRLLAAGWRVRCLARAPGKLTDRPWASDPRVEIVAGDAENEEEVAAALRGCRHAYYLIHSMLVAGAEYATRDRRLAEIFARAAAKEGVERIVYLGGLGETGANLSEHLASRREVETVLASAGVPVTVLRAAQIIGSGSAGYETLRYLVERLPVMITPRWVDTRCQPIAIRDTLRYLVECLSVPETAGRTLDIGAADVVTYRELMHITAEVRGLPRRRIIPVPVLTPRLSSWWIHFVTPISARVARPLAEGLKNEVVCRDDEARRLMPGPLFTIRESLELAMEKVRDHSVETAWTDAGAMPGDPDWAGGSVFSDRWAVETPASADAVYRAVCRIGGGHGWYAVDGLWRVRGALDRLVGGPGLRRGRRDPDEVSYGEALDFWRVTEARAPHRLALRAEMKVPGEARLTFDIDSASGGGTRLVQTASFVPRGLGGLLYWYAVLPFHRLVFRGMLDGIRREAERDAGLRSPAPTRVTRLPSSAS